MSDFRKGLLWTAVPIAVISILSSIGANTTDTFQDFSYVVWLGALIWFVAALIIALVQYNIDKGNRELASGILSGCGLGIIALGVTCFANIQDAF